MKKRFLLIASLLALSNEALIAQQNPTPYTTPFANTPAQAVTTANAAWYRGGNNNTGPAGNANIFGTLWNSPIYTQTAGVNRMKLNATVNYGVNGYAASQKNGFLLLGISNNSITTPAINNYTSNAAGAFSLLHLNGPVNSAIAGANQYQEYGYRPWMETGVTFTGNRDFAYYGLRAVGTFGTDDRSEAVFLWADNGAGGTPDDPDGPDNMVFRFSGYGGSDGATVNANRLSTTDLDGLHVATFNPSGYFGLGNTFGMNATGMTAANYVRPKSVI